MTNNNAIKNLNYVLGLVIMMFLTSNLQAQINLQKALKSNETSQTTSTDDGTFQQLLKAFDPGKSFTSPDKYAKLLSGNKDMVNKGLGILNGTDSESDKTGKLNLLKTEHLDFLQQLLGDSKAADYLKVIKPKIEPLANKLALAKLFL